MGFGTFSLHSYYFTYNPGRCAFAFVYRLGILLSTNEVRLFLKKFQFPFMSLEFGLMWKYVIVSLFTSFLSLSLFADLYWKTYPGGFLLRTGMRFILKVTASWSLMPGMV